MKHFKNRMMNTQPLDLPVTREDDIPKVNKVQQQCPRCGAFRHKLVYTRPMPDGNGREERRRCKSCLKDFDVYDPNYRRLESKQKDSGAA